MKPQRARGFSLVELIVVIVLLGIISGVLVVFVRPALDSFAAQRTRSELQGASEAALAVMQRDIRRAVPNSIRTPGGACFELVPTIGGGRYRMAPPGNWLDSTQSTSSFDWLGSLNGNAAVGDEVVIGNQDVAEVYAGSNRSSITGLSGSTMSISPKQFPLGYAGGRFVVVPASEPTVFFVCRNAGISNGQGTGTLVRRVAGYTAAYPTSCPASGGEVLASRVSACSFSYGNAAQLEYGLVTLNLQLTRDGETATLQLSTMVSNAP
jgi:MSHA biogenesis protein MshO